MASSRVVLSPLGWSAVIGSLLALLLGLYTLNLLLLVIPLAVLTLTVTELLLFDRATRDFGPGWFRWQRFENSAEVRMGGFGSMAIDLERSGASSIYVEVFDHQPETFEVVEGSPRLLTWWTHDTPLRIAYLYRPRERGRFRVGPTIVVAHDPLGFGFRIAKLENRWEVTVVPAFSLEEQITVPPGLHGGGEAHRRRLGVGTEFRSLREYQPSDDARKIAWRRSGAEKVYVREHEEEARPDVLILLDTGWDMRLGIPGTESLEQGVEGGTVIAGQAFARSERVALLTYSDRLIEYVPAQRLPQGPELLSKAFGRVALLPEPFNLLGALAAARERLSGPTVIILLSTLLTVGEPVEGAIADLRSRGHRLVALCPDFPSLFPPVPDPLAADTMSFALGPVEARAESGAKRLRDGGATVIRYSVSRLRETAAEVVARTIAGGDIA